MAFASANYVRSNAGSLNVLGGTWTGSAGDTEGTVTGKGYAINAEFDTNLSTGPSEVLNPRITNSSGTWTVTVPYSQTVTAGTFTVVFK